MTDKRLAWSFEFTIRCQGSDGLVYAKKCVIPDLSPVSPLEQIRQTAESCFMEIQREATK